MDTLRKGDEGDQVVLLTEKLAAVGLLDRVLHVFDETVELAVKAWQVHNVNSKGRKLTVDGIVGPATWGSFNADPEAVFKEAVPDDFYNIPDGGSETGRVALQIGLQEMWNGAREIGKNNAGPFVEKYHQREDASELQWSWCAAFVCWCYKEACKHLGVDMPFDYTGGAQNLYNQFKKKGWAYDAGEDNPPRPGDICVWWRGKTRSWQGHVGIVWGYNNGLVYVLEGNVGRFPARVRVFDYELENMSQLIGFGRVGGEQ